MSGEAQWHSDQSIGERALREDEERCRRCRARWSTIDELRQNLATMDKPERVLRLALWAKIIKAACEAAGMESTGRPGDPATWPDLQERAYRIELIAAALRKVTP